MNNTTQDAGLKRIAVWKRRLALPFMLLVTMLAAVGALTISTQDHYRTQSTFRTQNLIVDNIINNDTEVFFSCSSSPLDNIDPWLGGAHNSRVEIDMAANHCTINGIIAGKEGDLLYLWNGGGGGSGASAQNPLTITLNNAASSIPVDDIYIANGKGLNIPNNDGVLLIYDGGFGWTVFGGATSSIRATEFDYETAATPTALASGSSVNNYNPWTGTTTSSFVKQNVTGSGTATITGLTAAGAPNSDGRVVVIKNVSGSGTIAFTCKDGASTPDDQIACPNGSTFSIAHDESVTLLYDDTVNFYSVLSLGKAPGTGTVTSVGSGSGISGGPITTSGNLAIDPTYTQRRVSGTCTAPTAIVSVNQDGTVSCGQIGTGSLTVTVNADPGGTINLSTQGTQSWIYNNSSTTGKPTATTPTALFRWKLRDNGLAQFTQIYAISNTTSVGTYTQGTSFTTNATDDIIGTSMVGSNGGMILANVSSGINFGWMIHVPVTNISRTFKMYVIVHGGTATVTAHLEDASAVDASATFSAASGSNVTKELDIVETAGSPTFLDAQVVLTSSTGVGEVGYSAMTEQ